MTLIHPLPTPLRYHQLSRRAADWYAIRLARGNLAYRRALAVLADEPWPIDYPRTKAGRRACAAAWKRWAKPAKGMRS